MTRALLLLLAPAVAAADPDLRVHHTPVQHLTMRKRTAAASKSPAPVPARPAPAAAPPAEYSELTGVREPNPPVAFQLDVGYAIDGTSLSDHPQILGDTKSVSIGHDFAQLRPYGFADAYLSTHGVGYMPLSTYFAARVEITRQLVGPDARDGGVGDTRLAPPVASWFDRSNVMLRSGWGEIDEPVDGVPVSLRFGQLYIYGPWVMHLQGAHAAVHHKLFDVSAYVGRRAPDYTYAILDTAEPTIAGASAKIDLRGVTDSIPLVFAGETMRIAYTDGTHSDHLQGEVDWRPTRETTVIGQTRAIDGALADEHVQVRTHYKQITNVVIDLQHRNANDWQWDPSLVGQPTDASEARRYLDLGPVQPQTVGSVRAGTVLYDNIDVLGRFAFAQDLVTDATQKTADNASYYEFAGAVEVRLRRTVSLGVSILRRKNTREPQDIPIVDTMKPAGCGDVLAPGGLGTCLPLPDAATTGEDDFTEIGTSARFSLGARRFSATVEVYGRKTEYTKPYCAPGDMPDTCSTTLVLPSTDVRGGGRVTLDAYLNKRLRLFAAYDLSSNLDLAPEINGYKSLRLVMEGVY